jgi:hypothetical protein
MLSCADPKEKTMQICQMQMQAEVRSKWYPKMMKPYALLQPSPFSPQGKNKATIRPAKPLGLKSRIER